MTRILETNICVGLGDIIYIKGQIEPYKNQFDQINITYDPKVINTYRKNDNGYKKFLEEIGTLFFSEKPYILNKGNFSSKGQGGICQEYSLPPTKPDLKHLLCKGQLLNIDEEYIVITTKLRMFPKNDWVRFNHQFWKIINMLSKKYKIVVIGEKVVEMSNEYKTYGTHNIYSIYHEIIKSIPKERVVDLTIPALGITSPILSQIQQDCLIMNQAKFVVMLSTGGAFCMATATANMTIGYRSDNDPNGNVLFDDKEYPDAYVTRNWQQFINRLETYIK